LAADTIWREIQLTNTAGGKPVVVSMGGVAASGGYYVAAPATRIFANPATITGSIGIFYGKADVAELLHRIGVGTETYKTAPRADAESMFRPYTPEERTELERKVRQFYEVFLSRVSIGRRMDHDTVDGLGQGRVYTGEQALKNHLVDELGGLRQALNYARKAANLPDYAPIVELPPPDTSLLGRILGIEGVTAQTSLPLPKPLLDMARALAPFAVQGQDMPFARLEWVTWAP
jgi:protease-4